MMVAAAHSARASSSSSPKMAGSGPGLHPPPAPPCAPPAGTISTSVITISYILGPTQMLGLSAECHIHWVASIPAKRKTKNKTKHPKGPPPTQPRRDSQYTLQAHCPPRSATTIPPIPSTRIHTACRTRGTGVRARGRFRGRARGRAPGRARGSSGSARCRRRGGPGRREVGPPSGEEHGDGAAEGLEVAGITPVSYTWFRLEVLGWRMGFVPVFFPG